MAKAPTLLILALLASSLSSQVRPLPPHRVPPVRIAPQLVTVVDLGIDMKVRGPVARITQEITLRNAGRTPGEFDLVFPLGQGNTISGLELRMGDQVLEGKVYGKEEAAAIYQALTRRTRDPALLEHYGEGLFRARVFPVPAGGTQVVTLSYSRVVTPEGNLLRLHVPLTAFRRVAGPLNLHVKGAFEADRPITTLYSPTHLLEASKVMEVQGDRFPYRSTFAVNKPNDRPERDLVIYFKALQSKGLLDVSILSERPDPTKAGYFLAVINGIPNKDLKPEPRDVIFVLDRSGSMKGKKIEQAKEALKFLVERLRPEDRFNLITYSAGVEVYAKGLQAPDPGGLGSILGYIDAIEANGGTNIEAALKTAMAQFSDKERTNQIIFLTDGLPTVGERDGRKICAMTKTANLTGTRVIAFGVGYDVNGAFLDRLAVQNKGLSEYVLPSDNIEEKVPGFYSRMQTPLLLDATIELAGVRTFDIFPKDTGDIYGGHQLLVVGRYVSPGEASLVVKGRRGKEPIELTFPVDLAEDARGGLGELVARIWASKKVGYLVDEIRLNGENKELVDAIVDLGTRFGILTEYTSFLAAPEVDLAAVGANRTRTLEEFRRRGKVESGTQGVAQAANSKQAQRASVARDKNRWLGDDGRQVVIETVQNVQGRALYLKGGTWLEASVPQTQKPDLEVTYFSPEFFQLLDQHPWLNRCVARTGDLTLKVDTQIIRFRTDD